MGVECASCGQAIPPGQFRCGSCGAVQTSESFDDYGGLTEVAAESETTPRAMESAPAARPTQATPAPAATSSSAPPPAAAEDEEAAREPAVPRGTFASELPDRAASGDQREGPRSDPPPKSASKPQASAAGSGAQNARPKAARPVAKPPYLASEILREDIAPTEPARTLVLVVLQVAPALGALAALLSGLTRSATWVSVTALAGLFLLTRIELTYAARATLVSMVGGGSLALVAVWRLALGGGFEGPVLAIAATLLPAALLFRSWYRAAHAARVLVGMALAFALVWAASTSHRELLALQFSWQSWVPALVWYLFGILCLLSLLAFMGGETTGGCDFWALGLVVWYGLHACVRFALESADPTYAFSPNFRTLGLVEPALAAPTAIALAQLFARHLGARAPRRSAPTADA